MKNREYYRDRLSWENPLKDFDPRAYFADEVFPEDPRSEAAREAMEVLNKFYCDKRKKYGSDLKKLQSYLNNPDEQLFIIEGEVGIGKTWFIRYHLAVEAFRGRDGRPPRHYAGVVDLLRAGPSSAERQLYRQICPILEEYFNIFFGSTRAALHRYARDISTKRYGAGEDSRTVEVNADVLVRKWLEREPGQDYAETLLAALESLNGPILFVALDNLDRVSRDDQESLVDLSIRILRNSRVRLIVPLRYTSRLLRDRYRGLHEVRHQSMQLSEIDLREMLKPRFTFSKTGEALDKVFINDVPHQQRHTFPQIFDRLMSSEAGELLTKLAGSNCRVALHLIRRYIESDQLKSLNNVGKLQFMIASLMLTDTSETDPGAAILNVFDNEERNEPGNALIRYRVLEYISQHGRVILSDRAFIDYFARLGYSAERIRHVLSKMMMVSMIYSEEGYTPQRLLEAEDVATGALFLTETGESYNKVLLKQMWYYVVAKRGLQQRMPHHRLSFDSDRNWYFVTHTQFVEYLKEEEEAERNRAKEWARLNGHRFDNLHLTAPHKLAQSVLFREAKDE